MSTSSTSPKRGIRSSLKNFFDKRIHGSAHKQSGHDAQGASIDRPALTDGPQASNWQRPNESDTAFQAENTSNTTSLVLEKTLKALHQSAGVFPPLQTAIEALTSGLEAIPVAEEHRRSYNSLLAELNTLHEGLEKYRDKMELMGVSDGTANIILSIEAEAKFLKGKRDQNRMARILTANNDEDDLMQCYRRIETLSRQLQANIGLGTWSMVYEQLMNTRLGALSPALLAGYNSTLAAEIKRRTCTENTRVAVLNALDSWSNDASAANIYWMSGMAGTGKTTIATTISQSLFKRKQLGATFFCTRTSPECSSINKVIPTLAYQLARYSRPFQAALNRVLDNDPDIATRDISLQFERLLNEPLLEIRNTIPGNIVIIIDALDECRDHGGVTALLNALFYQSVNLPIKFFITSRPEPEIREQVLRQQEGVRDIFYLHDIEQSIVQADIELYLREELAFISPAEYQIKQLAQLAGSLFIYAATVVRYIQPGKKLVDPHSRLELVLSVEFKSKRQYAELDMLYNTILNAALDQDILEPIEMEHARHVLWTCVCAREPIFIETLAEVVEISQERVLDMLQPFLSVLHLYEKENRVSTLHASFPDFMFNPERSGVHFCDQKIYGQRVTARCFAIIKAQLRFNICGLESSFLPDASITDLERRIYSQISPSLLYACRYWADHLVYAIPSSTVVAEMEEFLNCRLLFWMEVLNMTKSMITGIMELQSARLWLLDTNKTATRVLILIEDAQDFVTSFSAGSISLNTPHIYVSALPFCSPSSTVSHNYRRCTRGLINPQGALFNNRGSALLAVRKMPNPISCISSSADGTLISIGDRTGMISILNQRDGTPLKSFVGHNASIECVEFSPDNLQFASGSFDFTICCWSRNGSLVLGPLEGHNGGISSVAFSPDGKRIVSGGRDCTVRLWNSRTGSLIASSSMKLNRNDLIVSSIAFTPDGARVVSGLNGGTIHIWDIQNNTVHAVPSNPHTTPVELAFVLGGELAISNALDTSIRLWSVVDWSPVARIFEESEQTSGMVVSPDGSYVAGSSSSGDIYLWSVINGAIVAGPLEGPMGPVMSQSLAFSADGTRLFSAAHDATLCMWNVQKEAVVSNSSPYEGHIAAVNSVIFSSDGTQIFSCADDSGFRIWGVDDGSLILSFELSQGNPQEVSTVAFSHDNTLVAAGSYNNSIDLWSVERRAHITTFSNGHTNIIYSLSFSPDGKLLASGSADNTVCIWEVQGGVLSMKPLKGHTEIVNSVQFSPNSRHIASGSSDRTVCLWDATSGQLISQLFSETTSGITCVVYSVDGEYVVAGDDGGDFHVWALTYQGAADLLVSGSSAKDAEAISSIALAPNSTLIATGSDDGAVNVWDRQNGYLVAGPFKDHSEEVNAVAWSPDGNIVASCSGDRTIRLIDIRLLTNLPTHFEGDWNLRDDGWVENEDNQLFWVSPELHQVLPKPYNRLVIGPQGTAFIDYGDVLLGENWIQCYQSVE